MFLLFRIWQIIPPQVLHILFVFTNVVSIDLNENQRARLFGSRVLQNKPSFAFECEYAKYLTWK